jgi:hypothetical protein
MPFKNFPARSSLSGEILKSSNPRNPTTSLRLPSKYFMGFFPMQGIVRCPEQDAFSAHAALGVDFSAYCAPAGFRGAPQQVTLSPLEETALRSRHQAGACAAHGHRKPGR